MQAATPKSEKPLTPPKPTVFPMPPSRGALLVQKAKEKSEVVVKEETKEVFISKTEVKSDLPSLKKKEGSENIKMKVKEGLKSRRMSIDKLKPIEKSANSDNASSCKDKTKIKQSNDPVLIKKVP